jgi:hypothetical protein
MLYSHPLKKFFSIPKEKKPLSIPTPKGFIQNNRWQLGYHDLSAVDP